jgi:hypothetical protein
MLNNNSIQSLKILKELGVLTMEKCFMLFRNDTIYIKSSRSSKVEEYKLDNPIAYPNVPLYFEIFNNEKIIKELRKLTTENIDKTIMQQIFAKKVFLLIPDDVTGVIEFEKRGFDEFARRLFGAKTVILGSECAFVAPYEEKEHICVSKTCRMMVLTYFKEKKIFKQKFIENKDYTNEELYAAVSELCDGIINIPKIYLNGIELVQYSDIGIIVDSLSLIYNFEKIINIVKIK